MIEDYYDFEQSVNHPRGPRWWPQIARFDGWGALRRGCPVGRPWRDRGGRRLVGPHVVMRELCYS